MENLCLVALDFSKEMRGIKFDMLFCLYIILKLSAKRVLVMHHVIWKLDSPVNIVAD